MRADNNELVLYGAVVRAHPALTRTEEFELSVQVRAGDAKARRQLIHHNIALVLSCCRGYAGRGCRMDDLVQEGMYGLLKAVEKFDPRRGNRFSTHASWWIKAYVKKYLRDMRAAVKPSIPKTGGERITSPRDFWIETPVNPGVTFLDQMASDSPDADEQYANVEQRLRVREAIARIPLSPVQRAIINDRLSAESRKTLQEVGDAHGRGRENIRQIEKSLKPKLRRVLETIR